MSKRYLGRLQLTKDNIESFHQFIESKQEIGYYVTKVQANKEVFHTYKEFKQQLIPPVKYRTIHITFSRNEEKKYYFNSKFHTRVWYTKDDINEEWDPTVKEKEHYIMHKALQNIDISFTEKLRDTAHGKDIMDFLWIYPVVFVPYFIFDGDVKDLYPFGVMLALYIVNKLRLASYNVLNIK